MTQQELLTRKQVEELTTLSRSSIYRFLKAGRFVSPIRIGDRAVRWRKSEILDWIAKRPRSNGNRDFRVDNYVL